MYRNGSCKKFEYPSPVSINPLQVLKIGYETGKIVFIQAKGYQSWVFYQFDIKVLKQVALVDSMRSSSESFHFFFGDSSSVRLIQHQFGAMPRAPGASPRRVRLSRDVLQADKTFELVKL